MLWCEKRADTGYALCILDIKMDVFLILPPLKTGSSTSIPAKTGFPLSSNWHRASRHPDKSGFEAKLRYMI